MDAVGVPQPQPQALRRRAFGDEGSDGSEGSEIRDFAMVTSPNGRTKGPADGRAAELPRPAPDCCTRRAAPGGAARDAIGADTIKIKARATRADPKGEYGSRLIYTPNIYA